MAEVGGPVRLLPLMKGTRGAGVYNSSMETGSLGGRVEKGRCRRGCGVVGV
jgi:hypothetical protein